MNKQNKLDNLIREYARYISIAQTEFFLPMCENQGKLQRYTHSSLARYQVYALLIRAKLENKGLCVFQICERTGHSRQAVTPIVKAYLAEGWAECETLGRRKYYRATDVMVDFFLDQTSAILHYTTNDEIMNLKQNIKELLGEGDEHILP